MTPLTQCLVFRQPVIRSQIFKTQYHHAMSSCDQGFREGLQSNRRFFQLQLTADSGKVSPQPMLLLTAFEIHFEKHRFYLLQIKQLICFKSHIYMINNCQNQYIILIYSCVPYLVFINWVYGLHPPLMTLNISVLLIRRTPTTPPW